MNSPEVTVLMSVYNKENYLGRAIESILKQTFENFEFIIIDDCSTDRSSELIAEYSDQRIRVINNDENLGLTKSLNKGIALAKGNYIARMDADDISFSDRLEKQLLLFKDDPHLGGCGCWTEIIDNDDNSIGKWETDYSSEQIYYFLNFRNCLTHSAMVFRKSIVDSLNGYNENIKFAQDYDLWQRMSKVARLAIIHEPLVRWRSNDEGISAAKQEEQGQFARKIACDNLYPFLEKNIDTTYVELLLGDRKISDIKQLKQRFSYYRDLKRINSNILKEAPAFLNRRELNKIIIDWHRRFGRFIAFQPIAVLKRCVKKVLKLK